MQGTFWDDGAVVVCTAQDAHLRLPVAEHCGVAAATALLILFHFNYLACKERPEAASAASL